MEVGGLYETPVTTVSLFSCASPPSPSVHRGRQRGPDDHPYVVDCNRGEELEP